MSKEFRDYLRALVALSIARASGAGHDEEAELSGDVYDAETALSEHERGMAADCAHLAWPNQVRRR